MIEVQEKISPLLPAYHVDGGKIFWYPAGKNLSLPPNLTSESFVALEWPERKGGIAYYQVEKPPKEDLPPGVYLRALTPREWEEIQKKLTQEGKIPQIYQVNLDKK